MKCCRSCNANMDCISGLSSILNCSGGEEDDKSSVETEERLSQEITGNDTSLNELFILTQGEGNNLSNENFINLTKLSFHNQPILSLTGIERLHKLEDMWITESNVENLDILSTCTGIKKLYLYSNGITEIPNLSNLKHLRVLDLSENKITDIKNLECLQELNSLYIADNEIKVIGTTLKHMKCLNLLDISGNPLTSVHDLENLSQNYNLTSLICRKCTELSKNSATFICNYRSYVVYHLTQLKYLDLFPVSVTERSSTKKFYCKKIIYYNTLHHKYLCEHLSEIAVKQYEDEEIFANIKETLFLLNIRNIEYNKYFVKDIETCEEEETSTDLNRNINKWKIINENWINMKKIQRKVRKNHLNFELRAVGNHCFRDIDSNASLVALSQEIMNGFTCNHLKMKFDIVGVKVITAHRLVMHEQNVIETENEDYNYLLMVNTSSKEPDLSDLVGIGCSNKIGGKELTTCVATADAYWLSTLRNGNNNHQSSWIDSVGSVERCMFIIQYPLNSTVIKINQKKLHIKNVDHQQIPSEKSPLVRSLSETSIHGMCAKLKLLNPQTTKSVFIVKYSYILNNASGSMTDVLDDLKMIIDEVNQYSVNLPLDLLDCCGLEKRLRPQSAWNSLTDITLQGINFNGVFERTIPPFECTRSLNLSYNSIESTEFVTRLFPNLTFLNLRCNNIKTLCTMKKMMELKNLDLSWNEIRRGRECLQTLKTETPNIEQLNLSNNPLFDITIQDHLTYIASLILPQLKEFSKTNIKSFKDSLYVYDFQDEKEKEDCVGFFSKTSIRWVSLDWTANILKSQQNTTMAYSSDELREQRWISIPERRIKRIINMPTNVVWADLSENFLTELTFLKSCSLLEEVNLSQNIISNVNEGLLNLQKVVKLDLSENYLLSLDRFSDGKFAALTYLDVSKNKLKNLHGLGKCTGLGELYATNNYIAQLDDIVSVKSCRELKVLDVSANEISLLKEFFNYVVFNLRKIEYINSYSIQESDKEEAYEMFGGILDQDFLLRRYEATDLNHIVSMTITQCKISNVHLSEELLPFLESLNLESNEITNLAGVHTLPSLMSLNLGFNQVHYFSNDNTIDTEKCFPELKTLYLNNNNISNLEPLNLSRIPKLSTLFLQGNYVERFTGLKNAVNLNHLVIDRNKITHISVEDCVQLENIKELYAEGNKLKDLFFLRFFPNLTKLFVGHNKLENQEELRNLAALTQLRELTLLGNPLCRVFHHYRQAMAYVPTLQMLDGYSLDTNSMIT